MDNPVNRGTALCSVAEVSSARTASDVLNAVRQQIALRWMPGHATDTLLALDSPLGGEAAQLFRRANGVQLSPFEEQPGLSQADMLAALDAAISLNRVEDEVRAVLAQAESWLPA